MVIKGGSRAGPKQLAAHLLRADTNERVEILELFSPIGDLHETFRDWQVLASGTRGSLGLYHANIDPAKDYDMTPEQWLRSVDVLEKELGLDGQPRAVVLHEKHGRQHIHVVWQRTDVDTMTMVPDGFNYVAHEKASYQLEQEFGHEHVPGKHAKRDREKQPEFPKAEITHAEWQQKERTGIDPRARKEHVTELYERSDSPQAFRAALAEEGYILATGDKRTYVLVDEFGEVHSLTRQLKNERAADVKAFLAPLDRDSIPDITEAQRLHEERAKTRDAQADAAKAKEAPAPEPTAPEPKPPEQQPDKPEKQTQPTPEEIAFAKALADREANDLKIVRDNHAIQVTNLDAVLDRELRGKMDQFGAAQKAEREQFYEERKKQTSGLDGYRDAVDRRLRPGVAAEREAARQKEFADFHDRQRIERRDQRTLLRQDRNQEMDVLLERQADEITKLSRQHAQDRERYASEQQETRRLQEDLEKDRKRQEELARSRDGPERGPTR